MLQSMTGYGKSVLQLPSKKISIEIKSLNSKNFDLNTRISSVYREKEHHIRKLLSKHLLRGKIDFSLFVEITGEETITNINKVVVKHYMNQLKTIASTNDTELLKMAINMPDALRTARDEIDQNEWIQIEHEIEHAITNIQNFRIQEGHALKQDIELRIKAIKTLLDQVLEIDPKRIEAVKKRLHKAIAELKEQVDSNRFEQELIYYIEKYDITEESVRLKNHLSYFTSSLNSKLSNGKKLSFICQEIGREINTIGSKANDSNMQHLVVKMKDELEKIKEQLLNVL